MRSLAPLFLSTALVLPTHALAQQNSPQPEASPHISSEGLRLVLPQTSFLTREYNRENRIQFGYTKPFGSRYSVEIQSPTFRFLPDNPLLHEDSRITRGFEVDGGLSLKFSILLGAVNNRQKASEQRSGLDYDPLFDRSVNWSQLSAFERYRFRDLNGDTPIGVRLLGE